MVRRNRRSNPLIDVVNDVIDTAATIVTAPVTAAADEIKSLVGGRRPRADARPRRRTRKPVVDGLVGIEANPGPPRLPRRGGRLGLNGARNPGRHPGGARPLVVGNGSSSARSRGGRLSPAVASGARSTRAVFVGRGTANVLGSQAHIFTGRCAIQNLQTITDGTFRFRDASGSTTSYVYLNPRICCQNATYNTPAGNCPIGVIAQPFRRFSFRSLRLVYEPTSVSTSSVGTVAVAFDPEVVVTATMGTSVMAYANFEASRYGPVWAPWTLDLTRWIDRSKWYFGETPATIATSLLSSNAIQGTLMLAPVPGPAADTIYGMFHLEFELALSELGPTEVFSSPALSLQAPEDEHSEYVRVPGDQQDRPAPAGSVPPAIRTPSLARPTTSHFAPESKLSR